MSRWGCAPLCRRMEIHEVAFQIEERVSSQGSVNTKSAVTFGLGASRSLQSVPSFPWIPIVSRKASFWGAQEYTLLPDRRSRQQAQLLLSGCQSLAAWLLGATACTRSALEGVLYPRGSLAGLSDCRRRLPCSTCKT